MGFLSRIKALATRPRTSGYGRLWDNTNTPGSTTGQTTMGTNIPLVRPRGPTPNPPTLPVPAPEPYLKGVSIVSPFREHSQPDTLQPEVPVKEPRTTGWGAIYNDPHQASSPAQVTVQQKTPPVPGQAPPMTRQRDNEWDAGSYRNLQKGVFTLTPSQKYFDQRTPIPEFTTPSVFAHEVIAGNNSYFPSEMQHGWEQPFVPEPGMHFPVVGVAPPTFLSKPIHVVTNVGSVEGHRSPIKNAKAPKRQRSGG